MKPTNKPVLRKKIYEMCRGTPQGYGKYLFVLRNESTDYDDMEFLWLDGDYEQVLNQAENIAQAKGYKNIILSDSQKHPEAENAAK